MEIALICSTPDCGRTLFAQNVSGYCVSCNARRVGIAQTAEARAKSGRTQSENRLAWCMIAYRKLNYELRRKNIPLEERKRIIAETAAADEAAERAKRKPMSFAEQLEAVRNGAALTERVVMPSRRATHVVGGSSLGDL